MEEKKKKKISVEKNLLLQVPCRAFSTKQRGRKNLAPLETAFHAFCRRHDDVTMPTVVLDVFDDDASLYSTMSPTFCAVKIVEWKGEFEFFAFA